jgi:high frequency lysogenization protein
MGCETALNQLGAAAGRDPELSRYAVTVLYLERRLSRQHALLDTIREGIETVRGPAAELGVAHPEVIARLGACYQQTLSTLRPRIIVHGEPATLGDPDNRQRIRALLLAAIRAAVLWRQCGGGRLTLLLHRRQLLQSLAQLQDELQRAP